MSIEKQSPSQQAETTRARRASLSRAQQPEYDARKTGESRLAALRRRWRSEIKAAQKHGDIMGPATRDAWNLHPFPVADQPEAARITLQVHTLLWAAEINDPYVRRHAFAVARIVDELCLRLDICPEDRLALRWASLLHDVGKIAIARDVLQKPGPLTDSELAAIREHPAIGVRMVRKLKLPPVSISAILHHHERVDGGGYPDGLAGEAIPLGARIVCVADAIDAMRLRRTYKPRFSKERIRTELVAGSGTHFDPAIVDAALAWLHEWRPAAPEPVDQPSSTAAAAPHTIVESSP